MPKQTHNCAVKGCSAGRGEGQIMCRDHWTMVPRALQQRVYSEYHRKRGSPAHLAAIRAAVKHVDDFLDERMKTEEATR